MARVSQPPSSSSPRLPAEDTAFSDLLDPRMKWGVRRARWQANLRDSFQRRIGVPLEESLLRRWADGRVGGRWAERRGLPRRSIETRLGEALVVHVDPRELIRDLNVKGVDGRRPSSSAFIWDGDWDRSRGDLRRGSRYRFISDIDIHRADLTQTERFRQYRSRLESGHPWSSYHQGILLDTEDKILAYLQTYLGFLDDMANRGFDAELGKDALGVAVTREGRLLKINRGLHRLAMAQRLGLESIPVVVRAVHRQWWQRVVEDASGEGALVRVAEALPLATPETRPGELDPGEDLGPIEWPASR
ncbi:hypothetical protein [Salinicola halimionae]|uniref:hypothetical protein n=1 Tax=Salinicola halimionae TaxID=1949081 RepID=UPI00165FFEA5|nr:hypothetical protein [Salinicola halimionae]